MEINAGCGAQYLVTILVVFVSTVQMVEKFQCFRAQLARSFLYYKRLLEMALCGMPWHDFCSIERKKIQSKNHKNRNQKWGHLNGFQWIKHIFIDIWISFHSYFHFVAMNCKSFWINSHWFLWFEDFEAVQIQFDLKFIWTGGIWVAYFNHRVFQFLLVFLPY